MSCSAAKRIALVDPVEHLLARDADRIELQVGDRRLDHREADAELDERLEVGGHRAREAPDLGAQPGRAISSTACQSSSETRGKPASIRSIAELVEEPRDLELLVRVEHDADRLLAVAQRRVVETDAARRSRTRRSAIRSRSGRSTRHHSVRERRELLGARRGDQEVVLDAQAAAAVPVAARLDREHHALFDLAAARLMRVRRLVRARADAVADRVRRLARDSRAPRFPSRTSTVELARCSRRARSGRSRCRRRPSGPPRARGSRRAARRCRAASCGRPSSRRRRPRSRTASARPRPPAGRPSP